MLLENITAATLSIQVKTFAFQVIAENPYPHFSLPFGFYYHHCIPQWHTAAGWPPPKCRCSFHLHILYTFFLLGNIYCPSSILLQSPALGKQFLHFEMELGVVTQLRQHWFTKAFLNWCLDAEYSLLPRTPLAISCPCVVYNWSRILSRLQSFFKKQPHKVAEQYRRPGSCQHQCSYITGLGMEAPEPSEQISFP